MKKKHESLRAEVTRVVDSYLNSQSMSLSTVLPSDAELKCSFSFNIVCVSVLITTVLYYVNQFRAVAITMARTL